MKSFFRSTTLLPEVVRYENFTPYRRATEGERNRDRDFTCTASSVFTSVPVSHEVKDASTMRWVAFMSMEYASQPHASQHKLAGR
jgi:hypothetical protein